MTRYKKKSRKGIWIWIGIILCICIMVYAGSQIYTQTREYAQGDQVYDSLKEAVTRKGTAGREEPGTGANSQIMDRVDVKALRELSGDAVAWIYSEGTVIDYPVMQAQDNNYYLTRLYDGTQNKVGSIFLDYRNAPDFSDQNSILYGHHMKSGKMFAELEKYKRQDYYEQHPSMILFTPDATYEVRLVAGYVVNGTANNVERNFEGEAFADFIDDAKKKSTFTSDTVVESGDRIVTMVTCTYDYADARYALIGKLVELD